MEAKGHVFVDNIPHAINTGSGRRHNRADLIAAQRMSHTVNTIDSPLITVTTGAGTVAIVKVCWSVKRRRNVDGVLSAEGKDFVGDDRKICCNHKAQIS